MEIDPTTWAWSQIVEKDLSPAQGLVLLAIARRASVEHEGICWPGSTDIHARCSLDPRYVRRTIRVLEHDHQLFKTIPCTWSSGTTTSNVYVLNLPRDSGPSEILKMIRRARGDVKFVNETLFIPGGVQLHFGEGLLTRVGPVTRGPETRVGGSPDPGLETRVGGSPDPGGGGSIDPPIGKNQYRRDRNASLEGVPISSGRGKLVGAGAEYFRSIQTLLGQMPGVQINVLNPRLVGQLYRRRVPFSVIEAACWLSVARAQKGPGDFTVIKSFRYFQPCIEEILQSADNTGSHVQKAMLRQAAFYRLKLMGDAATDEDRQAFEALYGK